MKIERTSLNSKTIWHIPKLHTRHQVVDDPVVYRRIGPNQQPVTNVLLLQNVWYPRAACMQVNLEEDPLRIHFMEIIGIHFVEIFGIPIS